MEKNQKSRSPGLEKIKELESLYIPVGWGRNQFSVRKGRDSSRRGSARRTMYKVHTPQTVILNYVELRITMHS